MKKLLLLFITLGLVLTLGACNSASDDYATKSELELLQEDITALQERIDNLVVVKGLNGVVDVYENQVLKDELDLAMVTLSTQLIDLGTKKDKIDKTKLPEYLFDDLGEYISFEDLGEMLKLKYFGEVKHSQDQFDVGDSAYLRFYFESEMSDEEVYARTVLLIEELRNYTSYTISYSELLVSIYKVDGYDIQTHISIPLNVILNDAYTVDLETIYYDWFEMEYDGVSLSLELAQQYYDDFVTNETFIGYVLDYK